jgi:hypothetical protein
VVFGTLKEADKQAVTIKNASVLQEKQLPFMSWTLYDFPHVLIVVEGGLGKKKNRQTKFGFIDDKGHNKPAFKYISN